MQANRIQNEQTLTQTAFDQLNLYDCVGVINLARAVNVRSSPNVNSDVVGQLGNLADVEIYDYQRNAVDSRWYQVAARNPDGREIGGWVYADYVRTTGCPADYGQ